jgi:predicted nucleic acid-binding protein
VAVKWFLPPRDESHVPEAVGLLDLSKRGLAHFIVPDLFLIEFASAMHRAVRRGRWSASGASDAVQDMLSHKLLTVASRPLVQRAFSIGSAYNCSVYDCIYVALAEEFGCEMITADEKLVNALGSRFPVRWLGSFQQMH